MKIYSAVYHTFLVILFSPTEYSWKLRTHVTTIFLTRMLPGAGMATLTATISATPSTFFLINIHFEARLKQMKMDTAT